MDNIFLAIIGILVGIFGTIAGIGGGIFISPFLFLLYKLSPQIVIGTSLFVVCCNAVSGSIAYAIKKRVNYALGWRFALMTIPGAVFGSYLSKVFDAFTFKIVFGILLVVISIYFIIRTFIDKNGSPECSMENIVFSSRQMLPVYFISFGIGILSSFLGIGGGIIHVPALIYILKIPVHCATATSHFILAFTAISGVISHYSLGNINFAYGLSLGLGAIIGAQIGAGISQKLKTRIIIIVLMIALLCTGVGLLIIKIS